MLDAKFIRANPKIVKEALKKRQLDVSLADKWIKKDEKYRRLKSELDKLRHKRNVLSEDINKLKKQKKEKEAKSKIDEAKKIPGKIKKIDDEITELGKDLRKLLLTIPNIPDKDVPVGRSEADNKVVKKVKAKKFSFKVKDHVDLASRLDLVDTEQAGKVAGARFYYLKNEAVILNLALQRFALDFLKKKGYKFIMPPFMLRKNAYEGAAHLEAFGEMLYKIHNQDLYLIATAEHPVAAFLKDELVDEEELPIKLAGLSTCFRKEAGSHGKDTKGIFRVHQFEKVEQFIFCKPKESEKMHKELLKNLEEIYKLLKLPYRITLMCTSELGKMASKQYDLEVWFPAQKAYREIASCSNCRDYQARRLNIKFLKSNSRKYLHTLNSTAIATERTIAAILENYQQKNGTVKIPAVLQKYCGFKEIKKKQ